MVIKQSNYTFNDRPSQIYSKVCLGNMWQILIVQPIFICDNKYI